MRAEPYGFPVFVNLLVRILSVPVTTYFIGPTEFGIFAILLASSAIFTVVATSFSSYVLNQRYRPGIPNQANVIATCATVEVLLGVVSAGLFLFSWSWFAGASDLAHAVSPVAVGLMAFSIPLGIPWTSLLNVILLDGRAGLFAIGQTLAPIAQLAATTAALWWGLGVTGLCIGYVVGTLVTTACVIPILLAHWSWTLDFNILRDMRRMAGMAIASNAMEAVMAWAERSQLARTLDAYSAGIYAHSQNYRAMLMSCCTAVTRAVHPGTIVEARTDPMNFRATTRTWNILFLILASAGISAALIGTEIIQVLTFGKFTAAGPLVPLWCMIAVMQQAARPQLYAMLARGHGRGLSAIKLIATAIGTASLLVSVPLLGLFGPVLSVAIKEVVHRGLLYASAYWRWQLGFYDWGAVAALLGIAIATYASDLLGEDLLTRVALCALTLSVGGFLIGRSFVQAYRPSAKLPGSFAQVS